MTLPSLKRIKASYDDNRRKISVTTGFNTAEAATTGYSYDNVGNLTSVIYPLDNITITDYDERNRPSSITRNWSLTTTFKYDLAGRKLSVTRPNGQVTTFNSYDAMNRLLQQTVSQAPNQPAVTKYTYTQAGLLETMKDPRLVYLNSPYNYTYEYDTTGRKTKLTYPPDAGGVQRTEQFTYDTAGRLQTFKNRNGNVQTFTYDALNRITSADWNDSTPDVTFGYDAASRLTAINNANATISRTYFNDNLLKSETKTTPPAEWPRTVSYGYDADANRASLSFPGYSFTYDYTGRNQLENINSGATTLATFGYDLNGNLATRDLDNSTNSLYLHDGFDRVTWVTHYLNGGTRTIDYGHESDSHNLKYVKRVISPASPENNRGEVFDYDQADQVTAVILDIPNPDTASVGPQTIDYDANGNRTLFKPYGPADTYAINNLNQYSNRNGNNAVYDANGNLTTGVDGSTYTYDAQNRLLSATKDGSTMSFAYDGLNRQVSRWLDWGRKTYSAWDGWDLVQEYQIDQGAGVVTASYLYGPTGIVKNLETNNYYYQDGSGSTSHLADSDGALLEWYRYDLQGTPIFYNADDVQLPRSTYEVRHLFTGQQWYKELDLYDLRNRFYSPDIGRFLQPDPIGFGGDLTNLYRYVGNNPVTRSDPSGLAGALKKPLEAQQTLGSTAWYSGGRVWVWGSGLPGALESDLYGTMGWEYSASAQVGGGGSLSDGRGGGSGGSGLFGQLPVNPFTPPNELPENPFDPPPQNPNDPNNAVLIAQFPVNSQGQPYVPSPSDPLGFPYHIYIPGEYLGPSTNEIRRMEQIHDKYMDMWYGIMVKQLFGPFFPKFNPSPLGPG